MLELVQPFGGLQTHAGYDPASPSSLPCLAPSMAAEALGLGAGIAQATHVLGRVVNVGVVGDNLPLMRLAAANGRIRSPGIWEILEGPIGVHSDQ